MIYNTIVFRDKYGKIALKIDAAEGIAFRFNKICFESNGVYYQIPVENMISVVTVTEE